MSTNSYATQGTTTLQRETRLLSVSGAWVRGTWIDDAVLTQCQRSANGGFGFRVRSPQVRTALVEAGLAHRDSHDNAVLTGTTLATRIDLDDTPVTPAPSPSPAPAYLGICSSSHHAHPVEATVYGDRRFSADPTAGTEPTALCERCADLLGSAGFFAPRR